MIRYDFGLNFRLEFIFIFTEEILDAEEIFFLANELENAINNNNRTYSGLKSFNKTRWGSHLMMAKSQYQNKGNIQFADYFFMNLDANIIYILQKLSNMCWSNMDTTTYCCQMKSSSFWSILSNCWRCSTFLRNLFKENTTQH